MLDKKKFELLQRIHLNGIHAMHRSAAAPHDPSSPHNTAYWDCVIGCRLSSKALELFEGKVPEPVGEFLRQHFSHESCHCCMGPSHVPSELAERVSRFHESIINEHGIISYLACMPLMGERMALATSMFHHYPDDPHATIVGGLDEFYHASTPLLLLAYMDPPIEKLELAIEDQEKFMTILGVTENDKMYPRVDGTLCTVKNWEAHNR
jgi:hypothetical protein